MVAQAILMVITFCDVNDVDLWNGSTKVERIFELFIDAFNTFRHIKYEDI